ncbi:MAG TPA: hypothetical protein VGL93_03810 [Streptosporangiaceae bacterium]|jgi:hypothetical protein
MTTTRTARLRALASVPLLLTAVLATACSAGSSDGPKVAQGTAKPTESTAAKSGDPFQQALNYAKCMRKHGVAGFPDPKRAGGGIQMKLDKKVASSPQYQAAQQACHSLQPGNSANGDGPKVDATKIAPWASCIRAHGVPNFPDPKNNGSALTIDFSGTGISPQSPAFQKALQACKSKSPGGGMLVKAGKP